MAQPTGLPTERGWYFARRVSRWAREHFGPMQCVFVPVDHIDTATVVELAGWAMESNYMAGDFEWYGRITLPVPGPPVERADDALVDLWFVPDEDFQQVHYERYGERFASCKALALVTYAEAMDRVKREAEQCNVPPHLWEIRDAAP